MKGLGTVLLSMLEPPTSRLLKKPFFGDDWEAELLLLMLLLQLKFIEESLVIVGAVVLGLSLPYVTFAVAALDNVLVVAGSEEGGCGGRGEGTDDILPRPGTRKITHEGSKAIRHLSVSRKCTLFQYWRHSSLELGVR